MDDTPTTTQKTAGFDNRIVSYEKIHKVDEKSELALVEAVDPQPNDVILDGMSGYGSVTKWILAETEKKGFTPEIYTLDESRVQVQREKENLPQLKNDHVFQNDIRETPFDSGMFDKVVIKMGVHELPQDQQLKIFEETKRLLKPGGKFVIWELSLDSENQKIFQEIARKKDELAGFDEMVAKRYFPRYDELHKLFEESGFTDITDCHSIHYELSTFARKDELVSKERKYMAEQNGKLTADDLERLERLGLERVAEFTEYVRSRIPEDMREKMKFVDHDNDVSFQVEKIIMSGIKPTETPPTEEKPDASTEASAQADEGNKKD